MDLSEAKHLPKIDLTPAELDEPAKLMLRAAAVIERDGLWRGGLGGGGQCIVTAMAGEAGLGDVCQQAQKRIAATLPNPGGLYYADLIYQWNDSHTQAEVVAKLRAVALGL